MLKLTAEGPEVSPPSAIAGGGRQTDQCRSDQHSATPSLVEVLLFLKDKIIRYPIIMSECDKAYKQKCVSSDNGGWGVGGGGGGGE